MRLSFRTALVLTACVLQLAFATVATAAPAQWQGVDVVSHSDTNGGVVTVIGTLPDSTPLPAQAQLSVPAGAQIQWVGEILGGDPANDLELTYTKTTAGDSDIYSFTMTKARIAQIEMLTAQAPAFDGTTYTSALAWTATQDIPEVKLALRIPSAATITSPTPGATTIPGETGYEYYTKTVNNVKAGDDLAITAVYTAPAVAPATTTTGSGSGSVATFIIVALLLVAGVALVFALRRKVGVASEDDADSGAADEPADKPAASASKSAKTSAKARDDSTTQTLSAEETATAGTGASKRNMVTAIVVGALVLAAVVLAVQNAQPRVVGDTVTEMYATGEACDTISIPIASAGAADPSAIGTTLFDAMRPLAGLKTATYNAKTSSLDVGYCTSETTEEAIRAALAPTGLLAEGGAAAPAQ